MKILHRYIFRELFLPFLLAVCTLSFIFMAGYLVRAMNFIIGRGVPFQDTLLILVLALPEMVSYTVPMSLLTSTMIVFGNLSQHNEIRAVKASGIHPAMVMAPGLVLGLLLSFLMFIFNDQVANNAAFVLRKKTKQMLLKNPKALIEPGRFIPLSDNIRFLTKTVEGDQLRDVQAIQVGEDNEPIRTISAESGEIVSDPDHSAVKIRLYNGSVSDAKEKTIQSIQFKVYEFPSFGREDIQKMQKKKRDYSLAELLSHIRQPGLSVDDTREIWTAFHQRIAFSLGSFIFVFIGVPIAILTRRGETVTSFAISLAGACLYYILFVGAKTVAIRGYLPAWVALWLPNLLLVAVGFYLLRRAVNR